MVKIICVSGLPNSGKTTAIRTFLEDRGVFFPPKPQDVRVVLRIEMNGRTHLVGVTSAGDTAEHVERNFQFLQLHSCDFIVCAAKSTEVQVVAAIQHWTTQLQADFVPVATQKLARGAVNDVTTKFAASGVAKRIWQEVS